MGYYPQVNYPPSSVDRRTHDGEPSLQVLCPPPYLIDGRGSLFSYIGGCPEAQTLEGYSAYFQCLVYLPLPCKKWGCRYCATQKIGRLSRRTKDAKPNRLLTLTVDTKLWEDPRSAFDGTRRQVPIAIRDLRKRFGEVEYLRVTELTRNGWPHYHLLVRSPYIPHEVVKKIWHHLTGASVVDLRQVKDHFNAVAYLIKYLSKMHHISWTERHVSYSKGFFTNEEPADRDDLDLSETQIIEAHPATYLNATYRGGRCLNLGFNCFAVVPRGITEGTPTDWPHARKPDGWDKDFPSKKHLGTVRPLPPDSKHSP